MSDPDQRLLLVMRHGKAESTSADGDHERELTSKGRAQAELVGDYLASQGVLPTRVLVSDALRTRQTWDAVASRMPDFHGSATLESDLYLAHISDVLDVLQRIDDEDQVVMIVGHEPTMSGLGQYLADDDSDAASEAQVRIGLPTGGLCVFSGSLEHWADLGADSLTLHTVVRG
jgi:phosphohistidine phosphatase